MGKINQLSSKVFNRIAAGEVVDRPYSVVKELVENSIDAGATEITIKVENGGISSIKVIDDGCGIAKDDLKLAFMPHATSKISNIKDLDNILTLGFRGEALASIASVSKITIVSKPKEQDMACKIYSEGGNLCPIEDSAGDNGTEITVNNLFFNTPVREKFLKSVRVEENEITATVSRFILGNSKIKFNYFVDNNIIMQSYGDGLESAFVCVYGVKIVDDCYYIESEKNGIKVNGYIGKPNFTKGNRSYQTVFINGRFILNNTLNSAISNAYSKYLMKRQYPFFVLNVTMPTEAIDVNVHPNKLDVRFSNNQIVYGTLYNAISKVLDENKDALNIVVDKMQNSDINNNYLSTNYVTHNTNNNDENQLNKDTYDDLLFCDKPQIDFIEIKKDIENDGEKEDIFAQNKAYLESLEKKKQQNVQIIQSKISIEKDLNYIGQALNTFLIFDDGEDLYIIDQHAAHERIKYDKFMERIITGDLEVQPLLIPFVFNANDDESEFLYYKSSLLKSMGILIEEFGRNSFRISTIPAILTGINFKSFVHDLLGDLNILKDTSMEDILREVIAQKACKSAIKAGDKLDESEVKELIFMLKGNLGLKCPHGRPIAIKISRTEIDKWFKRIV